MREVVIVGGGPAGAAAAIALARAGRAPLLLERDATVREKVCGEFLAEDAVAALRGLGCDPADLGAVPIRVARSAAGRRETSLTLPFEAWGLPRATLDAALLDAARASGAEIRTGCAVQAAQPNWTLRAGAETIAAQHLVLATGKHELRGQARAARGGAIGVKLPLCDDIAGEAIILLACAGGYAGLQARPGGGANLCAALDPRAPGVAAAARDARAFLAHVMAGSALARRLLRDARPALPRPMTVAGVPYGFVARGGGPFRIGDQASVIPSFCGDGVAMALASGGAAAAAILGGQDAAAHHAAWARRVARPMRLAGIAGGLMARAPGLLVAGAPLLGAWLARATRAG
jgi:flavin-dependent dehydrogenase